MSPVNTKILILSDTHALSFQPGAEPLEHFDMAIHCGDLTNDSKLRDYKATIRLLEQINAPIKVAIAGNHDFTLDDRVYEQKIEESCKASQEDISADIKVEYGEYGEAKQLLLDAKDRGIIFLHEEGTHRIRLDNGAQLKLYVSPYTPSNDNCSGWGFQYAGAHDFAIEEGTDIAITHGPPHGIMDTTSKKERIGCPQLFAAVARAQPRVHCFGHVHESWGARQVSWRPNISEKPHHFSDIDNNKSHVIESLSRLRGSKFGSPGDKKEREDKIERYRLQRYCEIDKRPQLGETMFVNAALMAAGKLSQFPWVMNIDLDGYDQGNKEKRKRKASDVGLTAQKDRY
ncbi:hypothetical protein NXS19_012422 [Fusarium pseudograminearum]|uniref:Calcineurin-like phosphoesterase domain-containing protein n=1 Tax=Fusarium pseudograminearum (strain CS3096) TaxID=1028729 RepID=K3VSL6_FUSPC|nr:hypothetical protein FPSE_01080 [Fusarium pseudograminearum CS3096]EKJ78712.1 hypothetical protein FPSE_01080 [Fusarium pseudograminearum CS3096]UZP44610.1 hypothetical protein NXS19_012422 [Fusarium pseudograminearum]